MQETAVPLSTIASTTSMTYQLIPQSTELFCTPWMIQRFSLTLLSWGYVKVTTCPDCIRQILYIKRSCTTCFRPEVEEYSVSRVLQLFCFVNELFVVNMSTKYDTNLIKNRTQILWWKLYLNIGYFLSEFCCLLLNLRFCIRFTVEMYFTESI